MTKAFTAATGLAVTTTAFRKVLPALGAAGWRDAPPGKRTWTLALLANALVSKGLSTVAGVLSSVTYERGDQTFPCDLEIEMADLASNNSKRKAALVRAEQQITACAADFLFFGLITIVSGGEAIRSNSPVDTLRTCL